jgi:hypothetical protein
MERLRSYSAVSSSQGEHYSRQMAEHTEAEKKLFVEMTNRRKLNGVRLRRWSVMMDAQQLEVIDDLWSEWVSRWGKHHAANHLIRAMADEEAEFRDREHANETKKAAAHRR